MVNYSLRTEFQTQLGLNIMYAPNVTSELGSRSGLTGLKTLRYKVGLMLKRIE